MSFYKNKKVLVTGGTGLIGRPLVEMLLEQGAEVRVASLDKPSRANSKTDFRKVDLTRFENCLVVCKNIDYVFNLVGSKGSPRMNAEKPASFFTSTILFNTNMLEAARQNNVKRYLYTSSVGVYSPAEIFYEDDVWKTFPSENDRFAGWAKRMGELQAEAYNIEYGWNEIAIVRPANVYGPYDNFNPLNSMVVPSLIRRAVEKENPFVVWGNDSTVRDFIHARDVARGMTIVFERCPGPKHPVNIGSGEGCSIKKLVDIVLNNASYTPKLIWDDSKPVGDKKRVMDISRAKALGFEPKISLEEGIKEVIDWYQENKDLNEGYNVFKNKNE